MQPIAELIWFREAAAFTQADRLRALPQSARAYHAFGTTSVFEGHGAATELLRVYKQAEPRRHADHAHRARLQPELAGRRRRAARPFVEAWAGWLGEPGFGDDWLKMSGLYVHVGREPADDVRARAAPYTGWAGFNSQPRPAARPGQGAAAALRGERHPRGHDRLAAISISTTRSTARFRSKAGAG